MASKFLLQVVEKSTGCAVQWAPGLAVERQFEDELCKRVKQKLVALLSKPEPKPERKPAALPPVPSAPPAPVFVEIPEPPRTSFANWVRRFFGIDEVPQVDIPLDVFTEAHIPPAAIEEVVEVVEDDDEPPVSEGEVIRAVREALKETFYEIKSSVRP